MSFFTQKHPIAPLTAVEFTQVRSNTSLFTKHLKPIYLFCQTYSSTLKIKTHSIIFQPKNSPYSADCLPFSRFMLQNQIKTKIYEIYDTGSIITNTTVQSICSFYRRPPRCSGKLRFSERCFPPVLSSVPCRFYPFFGRPSGFRAVLRDRIRSK